MKVTLIESSIYLNFNAEKEVEYKSEVSPTHICWNHKLVVLFIEDDDDDKKKLPKIVILVVNDVLYSIHIGYVCVYALLQFV